MYISPLPTLYHHNLDRCIDGRTPVDTGPVMMDGSPLGPMQTSRPTEEAHFLSWLLRDLLLFSMWVIYVMDIKVFPLSISCAWLLRFLFVCWLVDLFCCVYIVIADGTHGLVQAKAVAWYLGWVSSQNLIRLLITWLAYCFQLIFFLLWVPISKRKSEWAQTY